MKGVEQYLNFLRRLDGRSKQIIGDNTKKAKLEDSNMLRDLCFDIENEVRFIDEEIWVQYLKQCELKDEFDEGKNCNYHLCVKDFNETFKEDGQKSDFYDEIIKRYFDDFEEGAKVVYLEDGIACLGFLLNENQENLVLRVVHKTDYDNLFDDVQTEMYNIVFANAYKQMSKNLNDKIDLVDCSIVQLLNNKIVSDQEIVVSYNNNKLELNYNLEKFKDDVSLIHINNKEERELEKGKFLFCVSALKEELELESDVEELDR